MSSWHTEDESFIEFIEFIEEEGCIVAE